MQFFFRNCTHILTRTRGEKFEDMFLVKIASKGTSLNKLNIYIWSLSPIQYNTILYNTLLYSKTETRDLIG